MYTIHEVRLCARRSKQLLYESDHSSGSISELSLSYSSSLFYGSIGAEGMSDADSQSGEVEPYLCVPVHSNSQSSYMSHNLNDHEALLHARGKLGCKADKWWVSNRYRGHDMHAHMYVHTYVMIYGHMRFTTLQLQRRWLMVQKRKSYDVSFKFKAVETAKKSKKEAAREFVDDPRRLHEWCSQKGHIVAIKKHKFKCRRLDGGEER